MQASHASAVRVVFLVNWLPLFGHISGSLWWQEHSNNPSFQQPEWTSYMSWRSSLQLKKTVGGLWKMQFCIFFLSFSHPSSIPCWIQQTDLGVTELDFYGPWFFVYCSSLQRWNLEYMGGWILGGGHRAGYGLQQVRSHLLILHMYI